MNRPKDPRIRQKLLDAAVRYVLEHGVGGLSLRPLAKSTGTTARMLMHHFGSKETLVAEVLLTIERGFAGRTAGSLSGGRLGAVVARMWKDATAPDMESALRAMFEVWGQALLHPERYRTFLNSMSEPWIDLLRLRFERARHSRAEAKLLATLTVGAFQGLQLIRLSGGDGARSEKALKILLKWLDPEPGGA